MDFDELYRSIIPSQQSILERVDEYTLYCHYTGIEPLILGKAHQCPYRIDEIPSFSVFPSKSAHIEFMWKDHATGEYGTIFSLIQKIECLDSLKDVLARINEDFSLGYNTNDPVRKEKIVWYDKPNLNQVNIRIQTQAYSREALNYWKQFEIGEDLLSFYNVDQVKYLWMYEGQLCPTTATELTFSYRVGSSYQIYRPLAPREFRFRNNLPENYFFGYIQLPKQGDVLILDKSFKDLIFCRRLDYWAIAPKSENTMIPETKILELKERFKTIYIMFDSDEPGKRASLKYVQKYPFLKEVFLPKHKDKTDNCIIEGFSNTKTLINGLLI